MFPLDTFLRHAHDLRLAAKLLRDTQAYEVPERQAGHSRMTRRPVLALVAAAPIVLWLLWLVVR